MQRCSPRPDGYTWRRLVAECTLRANWGSTGAAVSRGGHYTGERIAYGQAGARVENGRLDKGGGGDGLDASRGLNGKICPRHGEIHNDIGLGVWLDGDGDEGTGKLCGVDAAEEDGTGVCLEVVQVKAVGPSGNLVLKHQLINDAGV